MVVDALSRKSENVEALLCSLSIIQPNWIVEAMEEWPMNVDAHSKASKGL